MKQHIGRLPVIFLILLMISACSLSDSNTVTVTPSFNGVPIVKLASPLPNETYLQGASVNILGRIENAGADIQTVDILLDNQSIGSATQPNSLGANAFTITNSWVATASGLHTVTLRATRADGTFGDATVTIAVEGTLEVTDTAVVVPTTDLGLPTPVTQSQVQPTPAPTQATLVEPTSAPVVQEPPTNTPVPPSPTSSVPQITVISGANVRTGPGLIFDKVGSLAANATSPISAISPDRQWYKIQFYNGTGWISAQTVTTSGELASLPVDAGPPPPAPTATPVPATTAPTVNTDLSITLLTTNPDPLVCNQAGTITVVVVNSGSTQSVETTLLVQDLYNNNPGAAATVTVKALGQNESVDLSLALTVSTNFAEGHTLRARIDPDNRVPESNETNNDNTKAYTLATGGC